MSETVAFDPGFANYVIDIDIFINNVYSKLMSLRSINQKRTCFKLFCNKIYNALENNIAFYYGCLLWAYYIKKENSLNHKEITGNPFLNLSAAQIEEYDYLMQVSFIENYFENFERDSLYYTGKKTEIPSRWKEILKYYTEFLELNKGFVNTKNTNDIMLPEELENKSFKEDINGVIQRAINEKNLKVILNEK